MRGVIPGLSSPHPIGAMLPALYLDDRFAQGFTAGLDEVLAPVLLTLDCLAAYFDPDLAPEDFLDWLAGWVAASAPAGLPSASRRQLVRQAAQLHRWRGTTQGLAAYVRVITGGEVTVRDSGGVSCSTEPDGDPGPEVPAEVHVRVRVTDPTRVNQGRLRELIGSAVPAHVRVTVEVTSL